MSMAHMRKLQSITICPACKAGVAARISDADVEEVAFACGASFWASFSVSITPFADCSHRTNLAAELWNVECSKDA